MTKTTRKAPKSAPPPQVSLGAVVREDLPLPVVHYPRHYGTFIGFAPDEETPPVLCTCAKPAVDALARALYQNATEKHAETPETTFVDSYFPLAVSKQVQLWSGQEPLPIDFAGGVCHRCNLVTPTLSYCHEHYGTHFIQYYGWYVNQAYLRLGIRSQGRLVCDDTTPTEYAEDVAEILRAQQALEAAWRWFREGDEQVLRRILDPSTPELEFDPVEIAEHQESLRTAQRRLRQAERALSSKVENIVRQEFGFRKVGEGWISETILHEIVKRTYTSRQVLFHHRPQWLRGMELDIYIPELKLAFEYQGAQHFKPIEAWGGQKALDKLRLRDAEKAAICLNLGVCLITVDYTEPLSPQYVRSLLTKRNLPLS